MTAILQTVLVGNANFRMIPEDTPCAKSLPRHAVDPVTATLEPCCGAKKEYVALFPKLANIVARYRIDYAANARALHHDVAKLAKPPQDPVLVLMVRESKTRKFAPST